MTLTEALALTSGEMVALIGAGGKTTTLFHLADELWRRGEKVLVTTTTRIFKPKKPHVHRLFLAQDLGDLLRELMGIEAPTIAAVGWDLDDTGKLRGLPVEWFGILKEKGGMDSVLIEADGAAMKPFKVPAEHEPVIPEACALTIWVMGIKVLGQPLVPDRVHRAERGAALLGVEVGTTVTEDLVARLVENPLGCFKGVPPKSRRIALINQADTPEEMRRASSLGRALIGLGIERAVITSYLDSDAVKEVLIADR